MVETGDEPHGIPIRKKSPLINKTYVLYGAMSGDEFGLDHDFVGKTYVSNKKGKANHQASA